MKLAESGSCKGHNCDGCPTCLAGTCCGADVAEPDLPRQGSFPGEWHGELGVLEEKDGKVRCHICGRWFVELGRHASAKHKVPAEAYRAYFGLACRRALCPTWLSEQRRSKALGEGLGHSTSPLQRLTSEQRSLIAYRREARAETAIARKVQLTRIAPLGAQARWAKDRPQNDDPQITLRRQALPDP